VRGARRAAALAERKRLPLATSVSSMLELEFMLRETFLFKSLAFWRTEEIIEFIEYKMELNLNAKKRLDSQICWVC